MFLFWQELNDSQLKRLHRMERDLDYSAPIYHTTNEYVRVTNFSLDRNSAEIHNLANMADRRFHEFAIAVVVSSVGIIVLSVYIFRSCKR